MPVVCDLVTYWTLPLSGPRNSASTPAVKTLLEDPGREVLAETLQAFLTASPPDHYHRLARESHARWASKAEDSPASLELQIHAGNWGDVTLNLSRR